MVLAIQTATVLVSENWCKRCGICIAFCPNKVLENDESGRVVVAKPEQCIACKICERLCPDFAINIEVTIDE
ncbi:ferredoxin [Desulfosporosinus sp. Tol-M]|nr:ferredoxin [Desulfosporosinus sp. Tol-M]